MEINMKISDVCKILEGYAPLALAEDFDNVGLIVGDRDTEVTDALLCLDVDTRVAAEAKELGANLIISHHPIMFNPLRRITADTPEGRCILFLIQNGISVYSAHTNLDSAAGGLNDLMAGLLGINETVPVKEISGGEGLGRIGFLETPVTMEALGKKLQGIFGLPCVRFTGNGSDLVRRIAVCSGGGAIIFDDTVNSRADVYISGDLKYSDVRESLENGTRIIELGHYDSEILAVRLFEKILDGSVKTHASKANINVYNTLT